MMATLTNDARSDLERYLRQVRTALRGHASVDAAEVERDVLGHIDAELEGHPEPVEASSLRRVLDRLGAPHSWVPPEESPAWRAAFNRLRSGPEDWRLAYLTFLFSIAGPALFMSPNMLWPLPPVLLVTSFVAARATLAVLDEHDEPVGARRWLIYPTLIAWYTVIGVGLLVGPVSAAMAILNEQPVVRETVTRFFHESFSQAAFAVASLAAGVWWMVLGTVFRRSVAMARVIFWPFAERFEPRHATRIMIVASLLLIAAGALIIAQLLRS